MNINVRAIISSDVDRMTVLVAEKRLLLEQLEPVMWRARENSSDHAGAFLRHVIAQPQALAFVAEDGDRFLGFIIGILQDAPPLYDPGGKSVTVDDFAVVDGTEGDAAASALLDAVMGEGRARGAVQIIVVAAANDARETGWCKNKKLHVASQMWTTVLSH
jgi:GNAT superfamily N-acetyltransferase